MVTACQRVALRDGVELGELADGALALRWNGRSGALTGASATVRSAVRAMACAPVALDAIVVDVIAADGPHGLLRLHYALHLLAGWGALVRSVFDGGTPLATLVPRSRWFVYPDRPVRRDAAYVLSRFAYLRSDDGALVLESPLAHGRAILHDPRVAAVIHALARAQTLDALNDLGGLTRGIAAELLALLAGAGFAIEVDDGGTTIEDRAPLMTWEPHDLMFHARSREGRHDASSGGTYRFADRTTATPALKPPMSTRTIELARPDLEHLRRADPPLERVLADRRSIRRYATRPITQTELGALLYRVARVTRTAQVETDTPHGRVETTLAFRPYPSAGALYELELYIAVARCDGLAGGLYRYDPERHLLEFLPPRDHELEGLLGDASRAAAIARGELQLLVILAARFERVAWKYASMAYAAILKHVGVVQQTIYLVATAMGLAACAIGSGDPDRFARAAGLCYYAEGSVGEMLLGASPGA